METHEVLVCQKCGNEEDFKGLGICSYACTDMIDGNGSFVESMDEVDQGEAVYDSVECGRCGAQVSNQMSKIEADAIIAGAYEFLKKESKLDFQIHVGYPSRAIRVIVMPFDSKDFQFLLLNAEQRIMAFGFMIHGGPRHGEITWTPRNWIQDYLPPDMELGLAEIELEIRKILLK